MDLPTVKAAVKAWEKAFKAENKRDPTKDDIKRDPNGIAEKYSLYRKLSKSSSSSQSRNQSQSQLSSQSGRVPSATNSQIASTSTSLGSRATPRIIPTSEYPTTPTPPTRRQSSGPIYADYHDDDDREEISLQAGPSTQTTAPAKSLKRTASKASLPQPTSPAHKLLTTPKKRPYTGPIHDPNPINPFAASPLRRSAMKTVDGIEQQVQSSPFVHATSPKKLKELLQENSLRKVQERSSPLKEITPRTKARKRLTGEMDETPAKSRVRRKRGTGVGVDIQSAMNVTGPSALSSKTKAVDDLPMDEDEDGDADEDEFGPTPIKPTQQQQAFHSLFELDNGSSSRSGPSRSLSGSGRTQSGSSNMVGRLLAAGGKGKGKASSPEIPPLGAIINGNGKTVTNPRSSSPDSVVENHSHQGENGISDVPEGEEDEVDPAPTSRKPKQQSRPDKTVSISEDEMDEWDPEAGHVRHRVRIVPTRSKPKKRWSDSEDDEIVDGNNDDGAHDSADELHSNGHHSPPLLSLLSLQSPNQRQGRYARLNELRYKALFNPSGSDARKLKAFQKGQEAFASGELEEDEGENDDLEGEDHKGDKADDDWESESDGWNRTGVEMDDDAW